MERKPWNWLSFAAGLAGALLVLGGVWGGIAIAEANRAAENERYLACMANLGWYPDSLTSLDDLELLGAAAEICLD